jgi:hypothetical protein
MINWMRILDGQEHTSFGYIVAFGITMLLIPHSCFHLDHYDIDKCL